MVVQVLHDIAHYDVFKDLAYKAGQRHWPIVTGLEAIPLLEDGCDVRWKPYVWCFAIFHKGVGEGGGRGGGARAPPLSKVGGHKWVCAPHFWAEQMF